MTKFILLSGNPVDGFSAIGPFDSDWDAHEFEEREMPLGQGEATLMELVTPEEYIEMECE